MALQPEAGSDNEACIQVPYFNSRLRRPGMPLAMCMLQSCSATTCSQVEVLQDFTAELRTLVEALRYRWHRPEQL